MTDAQRRFMHARDRVMSTLVNPVVEMLAATTALVEEHKTKAAEAEKLETALSVLQSVHSAAQGNFCGLALAEIWEFLDVDNQTAAMEAVRQLKAELSVANEHRHD